MIGFIACSIVLAFLVQSQNPYLALLVTPAGIGMGLALMAISLLAGYRKKLPTMHWHDVFASSCLLVWYGYWKPQFSDDAPMFFFYPVYYALLTATVTLALINKAQYFDHDSVAQLRYLDKITRFDMPMIIGLVLASLLITRHYALFPMAMTFFIVRHTIIVCLETVGD